LHHKPVHNYAAITQQICSISALVMQQFCINFKYKAVAAAVLDLVSGSVFLNSLVLKLAKAATSYLYALWSLLNHNLFLAALVYLEDSTI